MSDSPSPKPGADEARLNAERLHLAARWRLALEDPGSDAGEPDEFWEADEIDAVWAHAQRDGALLAMIREDTAELLSGLAGEKPGSDAAFSDAELARANARFEHNMQAAAPQAPQVLEAPEIEQASALTVGDVVEEMERESRRTSPEAPQDRAEWSRVLAPLRSSREALPTHITGRAMSDFWSRLGLSVPRELSSAFSQAARLLLMGRATPGARLSIARSALPTAASEEAELLASPSPEQPEEADNHEEHTEPQSPQEHSGGSST